MPDFTERVVPSFWGWLLAPAGGLLAGILVLPAHSLAAVLAAVGVTALIAGALFVSSPVVAVSGGELRAGRARVPLAVVGAVTALGAEEVAHAMGPGFEPRAYTCYRSWAGTAVRVRIDDPEDPTPFWLVSTRRPHALADAVAEGRGQAAHSEQTG